MKIKFFNFVLICELIICLFYSNLFAQHSIETSEQSNGAGKSQSQNYSLFSTALGQPSPIGFATNPGSVIFSGYLFKLNRSPELKKAIGDTFLVAGSSNLTIDLNDFFVDPDLDQLKFVIESSDEGIVNINKSDNNVKIIPLASGSTIISIIASDNIGGFNPASFKVTVQPSYHAYFELDTTIQFPSFIKASDYAAADYKLIGLPGASNLPINELLTGTHGSDWQIYWDNGIVSEDPEKYLVEFNGSSLFGFSAGRAFWIINKGNLVIKKTVSTAQLNATHILEIPLMNESWNIITNPFLQDIQWEKIQFENSINEPIWAFDGSFNISAVFKSYQGYYFDNSTTKLKSLKIPYNLLFSPGSISNMMQSRLWNVNIVLSFGDHVDKSTMIGVSCEAKPGRDRNDFMKPRSVGTIPMVYFDRPEWDSAYKSFASDIRPEFNEMESWDFVVQGVKGKPTELIFSGIKQIPKEFEVCLINETGVKLKDLRVDSLFRFCATSDKAKFNIIVGKKEMIEEKLNELALPTEFSLGNNYPNPFNPGTTIPIAIPVVADVSLKIYNILGEEVKSIYSGVLEPGQYLFTWDGRTKQGTICANGAYFYILSSNTGVTLKKKLIFLK